MIVGGNIDGTDQLAVQWTAPRALLNGTIGVMGEPNFDEPHMTI